MNPQPLYMHATAPLQVVLEAPALCVKSTRKADRLYPLRGIERIQVSGPVEWQTAALLACVEHGISIQFVDADGQTRARLVGWGAARQDLSANLQRLFNQPQWEWRYRQWCWARSLQTQRYVANRLGYRYQEARDLAGLPKWCETRLDRLAPLHKIRRFLQWQHLDLYGYVTQHLQRNGVWDAGPLGLAAPIDLAGDLTAILQWVLLLIRERELKTLDGKALIDRRMAAERFARHRGFLRYQVARIINQLEIWIMESH